MFRSIALPIFLAIACEGSLANARNAGRRRLDGADIAAVCADFGPDESSFFRDFNCNCHEEGTVISGSCYHEDICLEYQSEPGNEFRGLYSVASSVDFADKEMLSGLSNEEIVQALLTGDFLNCFKYEAGLYRGSTVCMLDSSASAAVTQQEAACEIAFNGIACRSCEICDQGSQGPLLSFDCSNLVAGERRNECNGDSIAGSVLRFLDTNADICSQDVTDDSDQNGQGTLQVSESNTVESGSSPHLNALASWVIGGMMLGANMCWNLL